jgi:hypothetical protein
MAAKKAAKKVAAKKPAEPGVMAGDQTKNQEGGDVKGDARQPSVRAGIGNREIEDQTTGDREVADASRDKVWTADSRERWGADQPSIADQLKSQMDTEGVELNTDDATDATDEE